MVNLGMDNRLLVILG